MDIKEKAKRAYASMLSCDTFLAGFATVDFSRLTDLEKDGYHDALNEAKKKAFWAAFNFGDIFRELTK